MDFDLPRCANNSDKVGQSIKNNISKLRDEIKDLAIYQDEEEIRQELISTYDNTKIIIEIISKLNKGTSWDDVVKEYKDKIIEENLGYNSFNASLESAYLQECKK